MKTATIFSAVALVTALAPPAAAAWADRYPPPTPGPIQYTDTARVLSSTPVYTRVNEPHRECWQEQTEGALGDLSPGGAILGAIVGGVVGHQIGGGSGKDAATAAGAAIGAITGDRMANDGGPRVVEHCRDVDHWSRRITGYRVIYRYRGNDYSTFMNYDPGATVRLNVSINVIDR